MSLLFNLCILLASQRKLDRVDFPVRSTALRELFAAEEYVVLNCLARARVNIMKDMVNYIEVMRTKKAGGRLACLLVKKLCCLRNPQYSNRQCRRYAATQTIGIIATSLTAMSPQNNLSSPNQLGFSLGPEGPSSPPSSSGSLLIRPITDFLNTRGKRFNILSSSVLES